MAKTSEHSAAKTEAGLNLQQEAFCQLYISTDREMFGNGVQCYIEAYDVDLSKQGAYDWARVCASQLLTKPNVMARINNLLEEGGFNDQNVDKQHLFLLNQHADLKTKMAAIKEYNAVKKRVEPNKVEVHVNGIEVKVRKS